jgi:hypothetical protein
LNSSNGQTKTAAVRQNSDRTQLVDATFVRVELAGTDCPSQQSSVFSEVRERAAHLTSLMRRTRFQCAQSKDTPAGVAIAAAGAIRERTFVPSHHLATWIVWHSLTQTFYPKRIPLFMDFSQHPQCKQSLKVLKLCTTSLSQPAIFERSCIASQISRTFSNHRCTSNCHSRQPAKGKLQHGHLPPRARFCCLVGHCPSRACCSATGRCRGAAAGLGHSRDGTRVGRDGWHG